MSDKQKTALINVINKFDEIKDLDPSVQILILRGECEANLEIEKQQIIDAYEQGDNNGAERVYYNSDRDDISGGQYFNDKFKTESK